MVYIVGTGPGNPDYLTPEARDVILKADVIMGARRMTEPFFDSGKEIVSTYNNEKIYEYIIANPLKNIAVLMSGDCGFYSGAAGLISTLGKTDFSVVPGISSMVYFCNKLNIPYNDIKTISIHGKEAAVAKTVAMNRRTFILLGENPCKKLCEYGLGDRKVYIGENLSYENEKLYKGTVKDFADKKTEPLSVMIVENENPKIRICDEDIIREKGIPMTKKQVRLAVMDALDISEDDICVDIGAGTGAVTVEMALRGKSVVAIEKNDAHLIEKNIRKFHCDNVSVIRGNAPECEIPYGDKYFIGGASGNIVKITDAVKNINDKAVIVITAVTLETVSEIMNSVYGEYAEVMQLSVSYSSKLGKKTMLKPQNPIFIFKLSKKE